MAFNQYESFVNELKEDLFEGVVEILDLKLKI